MTADTATLLVVAACLLGVALFALIHRRDGFGAVCAVIIGFSAAVTALVAFSVSDRSLAAAAQLQAFAVLVEVIGALSAAVGVALGMVLWRRSGADLIVEAVADRQATQSPESAPAPKESGDGSPGLGDAPPRDEAEDDGVDQATEEEEDSSLGD